MCVCVCVCVCETQTGFFLQFCVCVIQTGFFLQFVENNFLCVYVRHKLGPFCNLWKAIFLKQITQNRPDTLVMHSECPSLKQSWVRL